MTPPPASGTLRVRFGNGWFGNEPTPRGGCRVGPALDGAGPTRAPASQEGRDLLQRRLR